jgi:hypothetical protein
MQIDESDEHLENVQESTTVWRLFAKYFGGVLIQTRTRLKELDLQILILKYYGRESNRLETGREILRELARAIHSSKIGISLNPRFEEIRIPAEKSAVLRVT